MKHLPSKQTSINLLVLALLIAVAGLAVFQYQTNKTATQPVVTQKQYNSVVTTMQTHDAVNKTKNDQLTAQVVTQGRSLATVCAQLKTLKATNAVCTQ